ncbi:MAG: glycerophosphodiester phosphodiesterase family protein [Anaerostipes sp.]|nr:glycerophosphodiester phosphodiesterase family protein [Anaerostipes sp.]
MKYKKLKLIFSLLCMIMLGTGVNPVHAASVSKIKWSNVSSKKTLYRGNSKKFTVKITPSSASKAKLVWSSSNKSVASVSSYGTVKPKKNGTTYITCKVKSKPSKKVTCKVKVKTQYAKSVTVPSSKISLQKGKTVTVKGTVSPSYTYNRGLKYTTSNSKIATVSSSGKVTGKGYGTATIKLTTKDGSKKTRSYKVQVVKRIYSTSTKFIAHRGLSAYAPENTIKAYELAGAAGFWGAETDVRRTSDGHFILLHDETFKRTCGVDKKPENMTLEEVKELKIKSGNGYSKYKNYASATTVPTLEEYLNTCKKYNMVPVIEIKMEYTNDGTQTYDQMQEMVKGDMQKLHDTTKSIMGTSQYKYIAYDLETLIQLNGVVKAEKLPNVTMEHVVSYTSTGYISFYKNRDIGLDCKYNNLSTSLLKQFKSSGVATNVWTIDDAADVWTYINAGVDNITTNTKFW